MMMTPDRTWRPRDTRAAETADPDASRQVRNGQGALRRATHARSAPGVRPSGARTCPDPGTGMTAGETRARRHRRGRRGASQLSDRRPAQCCATATSPSAVWQRIGETARRGRARSAAPHRRTPAAAGRFEAARWPRNGGQARGVAPTLRGRHAPPGQAECAPTALRTPPGRLARSMHWTRRRAAAPWRETVWNRAQRILARIAESSGAKGASGRCRQERRGGCSRPQSRIAPAGARTAFRRARARRDCLLETNAHGIQSTTAEVGDALA